MSVRAILAVLVSTLLVNAVWAEDAGDWVNITESSKVVWQGKRGSGHITNVDGKKNTGYRYVYQLKNKQANKYEYGQAVVLLNACKKGYGYVYYNDMEGNFTSKDGFVRFGPTVADDLGSMACTSWDNDTGKVSRRDGGDVWEMAATVKESGDEYFLKKDTVRKLTYKGKPAISALVRFHNLRDNTSTYNEDVIAAADCHEQFGTLYLLDFDGALSDKIDVALNGDSVGSNLAGALCSKL
jgi:hypothetical protein